MRAATCRIRLTVGAGALAHALLACSGRLGPPVGPDGATAIDADVDRVAPDDSDVPSLVDADRRDDADRPVDADEARTQAAPVLVTGLDRSRFVDAIRVLSSYGDRRDGSAEYLEAEAWLEAQLAGAGYTVERHVFSLSGRTRSSLYVTRAGDSRPDEMYLLSAHLDGTGGGGGADDDASGVALVLEAARAFARGDVRTERSVRFVFWAAEETGLDGSAAYAADRASLQGVENPPGSGVYPEPRWLGVVQHDMILFDHGLPPGPEQAPAADIDVEYNASCARAGDGRSLATALVERAATFSLAYPAQLGDAMTNTDSTSFMDLTAAVSIRENRRLDEIGNGSNPHWHQPSDVMETYSDADFDLGFAALQLTTATTAELVGAWLE